MVTLVLWNTIYVFEKNSKKFLGLVRKLPNRILKIEECIAVRNELEEFLNQGEYHDYIIS